MNANKAPIWRDARRFPRYHKYTLGSDPRGQAIHPCRLVNRAWRDSRGRQRHVEQRGTAVDEFKLMLQPGNESRLSLWAEPRGVQA